VDNPAWLGPPDAMEGSGTSDGTTGGDPLPAGCEPLPPPDDAIAVTPADAAMLDDIIASAPAGATIELADGVYDRSGIGELSITTPGLTLRSASRDPASVVLDGAMTTDVIVRIAADDVTIADLTLRRATAHLVLVQPTDAPILRPRLHRLVLQDSIDEQLYVAYATTPAPAFVDDGEVACSRFEVTDAHRDAVAADCRLGGIRANATDGWHVHDNRFTGHWCRAGVLAAGTLRFVDGSRDTVVERNTLLDCQRGIGFGGEGTTEARAYADNPCTPGMYWGHIGGVIRNNTIWIGEPEAGPASDSMIYAWWTCDAGIFHNTVVGLVDIFNSIEYRFDRTTVRVANNLATHVIMARDGGTAQLVDTNVQTAELGLFVDPILADLHLRATADAAIDRGAPLSADAVADDFEGDPRDELPDLGADELVP